jgi:uncharacterized protein (TIGR03435 family)
MRLKTIGNALVLAMALSGIVALGVAQTAQLAFEVASIKPDKPGAMMLQIGRCQGVDDRASGSLALGRCTLQEFTLKELIHLAYPPAVPTLTADQMIEGASSWMGTDRFDINAKAENPSKATHALLTEMLQTLLSERFKLRLHFQTAVIGGYAMTVSDAAKLKHAPEGASPSGIRVRAVASENELASIAGSVASMDALVSVLSFQLERPVINKTNVTGNFGILLKWLPGPDERKASQPSGTAVAPGPSIFAALQEQLGLKLAAQNISIRKIVIDPAEKPSEN